MSDGILDTIGDYVTDKVKELAPDFLNKKMPVESKESQEKLANLEEKRGSLFGEVWESFLARQFPMVSRLMDLATASGLQEGDPEAYPLQREFETLTALSTLVPDKWLRYVTDPLLEQSWFVTIVDYYPLDGDLEDKILQQKDPQAVIDFLRMVHQDIVTMIEGSDQLATTTTTEGIVAQ